MLWWKRFRSTKATLPAATTASMLCAVALTAIWFGAGNQQNEAQRFGSTLANTLAKTTAGDLLDNQRINLAVIANHVSAMEVCTRWRCVFQMLPPLCCENANFARGYQQWHSHAACRERFLCFPWRVAL